MVNEFFLKTLEEEGKRLGISPNKKRALIREYLQTKMIASLYDKEESRKLSFIGGTSLRILRGLDRFSEDLDFDNLGLSFSQIKEVFGEISADLEKSGFPAIYTMKSTNSSGIGDLKFPDVLFQLKISAHHDEKLSVKINYTTPRIKPATEFVILTRFGFVQNVLTNTLETLCAQKIRAIIQRKDPQPRDFYDIVWFLSQNIHPDAKILKSLHFQNEKEAFIKLNEIFTSEIGAKLTQFKRRLQPFLLNESHISYLDMFPDVVKKFAD